MISSSVYNIFAFIYGLLGGSFIAAASTRMVMQEDIIWERSRCRSCQKKLSWSMLVPVFSWAWLLGKCYYCKSPIPFRYSAIELCSGFVFAHAALMIGPHPIVFFYVLLAFVLLMIIIIDFEHQIIPDILQIFLCILGIFFALYKKNIDAFFLPFIGFGIAYLLHSGFYALRKKDGLGWGDIKLIAVSGLYLHLSQLPIYFFIAGSLGIILGIFWKFYKKQEYFPFGPALICALWMCVLYPQWNINNLSEYIIYKL